MEDMNHERSQYLPIGESAVATLHNKSTLLKNQIIIYNPVCKEYSSEGTICSRKPGGH